MGFQSISVDSPASVGAMQIIADNPGITAAEIARRGGWSVFHIRNVLRYLRNQQMIQSERPNPFGGECLWRMGAQTTKVHAPVQRAIKVNAPNSVFALGAM